MKPSPPSLDLERRGFEPTFPLDASEVTRRTWLATIGHPLTWLPPTAYLMALAAGWIELLSILGIFGGLAVVLLLRWWWRRRIERASASVERELIHESNCRQNDHLRARMRRLRRRGASHGAEILGRLLEAKRRYEGGIALDGSHYSTLETMERLGDSICHGVCREVDALVALERRVTGALLASDDQALREHESSRRRCLEAIREGYRVLDEGARLVSTPGEVSPTTTSGRVPASAMPTATGTRGSDEDIGSLSVSIDGLREELRVTRRVRRRIDEAEATVDLETVAAEPQAGVAEFVRISPVP